VYSVKPLPEFTAWLDDLTDEPVRGIIAARIKRLALGLMGDIEPVGGGVLELRIQIGAGWRVYFVQRGREVIVCWLVALNAPRKSTLREPKPWLRG
jgi:putative addiction module killer protein